jgi:hypothetical protein
MMPLQGSEILIFTQDAIIATTLTLLHSLDGLLLSLWQLLTSFIRQTVSAICSLESPL